VNSIISALTTEHVCHLGSHGIRRPA
jgi:hypothetical protein